MCSGTHLWAVDYRSGVCSSQEGGSAADALVAELISAGVEGFEVDESWSGGEWDFSVYRADGGEFGRREFFRVTVSADGGEGDVVCGGDMCVDWEFPLERG